MAPSAESRVFTYADLESFPEDNLRREIIDGELIVSPSPATRHQIAVVNLVVGLSSYARTHGGQVLPAPMDVFFSNQNVVEPDVLFIAAGHLDRMETKLVRNAPDLVMEVSSPSTRKLELVRKRELYERFGVPEYWYMDLEVDRVEIYLLEDGRYPAPVIRYPGEDLQSTALPGFTIPVEQALAAAPPG